MTFQFPGDARILKTACFLKRTRCQAGVRCRRENSRGSRANRTSLIAAVIAGCALTLPCPVSVLRPVSAQDTQPAGVSRQDARPADASASLPTQQTFIPASELDIVLADDAEGVLLTRDEFDRLHAAAKRNAQAAPRTPAAVVVSSADYAARIDGDHLVIDATLHFEQFADGWQTLLLPLGGLSVEQAWTNGRPAQLARAKRARRQPQPQVTQQAESRLPAQNTSVTRKASAAQSAPPASGPLWSPEPALLLFHDQKGPATLKLRLSTRLSATGSDLAAAFRVPEIPSATLRVTAPAGRHLRIGGRELKRPAPVDQPAEYVIPVGGSRDLRLLLTEQRGQQQTDSLTLASTGYSVQVVPGEVTWQANTSLQVFGAKLNRVTCLVPAELEITDVASSGLESWKLADSDSDGNTTQITLDYRQPFDGQRTIQFRGVMAAAVGEPWSVPALVIRNAASHSGRIAVQHAAGSRLRLVRSEGVRPSRSRSAAQVFNVWRETFALTFETHTRKREVTAVVTARLDLDDSQVSFGATLVLKSRFEPLFDVAFRLPEEWTVEQLQLGGQAADWTVSSREAGWRDYSIPLARPLLPGQSVTAQLLSQTELDGWPIEANDVEIPLPNIEIAQASTVEGTLVVTARPDLTVSVLDPFALDPARSETSDERLRFFFQQADYAGTVLVSRTPVLLSARTLTFTRLDRETLWSHLEADLTIDGGGLREIPLGLSESAGEDLQFSVWRLRPNGQLLTPVPIVEQVAGDVSAGTRFWTLKLDRRVLGAVSVLIDVATKRNGEDELAIHELTVPAAERISGVIAVEGAPDQQLDVTAVSSSGTGLPAVDPVDVPEPRRYAPRERIVSAVRYTSAGHSVSLHETRFDRVAVPTAICYGSTIRSVIGQTGQWQQRATFRFVAVGAQSLRVRLPVSGTGQPDDQAGPDLRKPGQRGSEETEPGTDYGQPSRLWAALIDGSPIEVRSVGGSFLIPIPPSDPPDAQRTLTLLYRTDGEALTSFGELNQVPPAVSVMHSSGSEQRLEVLTQSWQLHYPDSLRIIASSGAFTPTDDLDTISVLGGLRAQLTRVNRQTLEQNGMLAILALLISGAIAAALKRVIARGTPGCAGCTITGLVSIVCLVLLSFLLLPAVRSTRESAVRRGALKLDHAVTTEHDATIDKAPESATAALPAGPLSKPDDFKTDTALADQAAVANRAAGEKAAAENEEAVRPGGIAGTLQAEDTDGDRNGIADRNSVSAADFGRDHKGLLTPAEQQRDRGGLLSLSLDLEVPADSRSIELTYSGTRDAAQGVGLRLRWQDQQAGQLWRACLALAVTLVLWLLRNAGLRTRTVVAALCVTLPLGLIPLAPEALHAVLDGLFLGGLLGITLWIVLAALDAARRTSRESVRSLLTRPLRHSSGTAIQLLFATLLLTSAAVAQDSAITGGGSAAGNRTSADRAAPPAHQPVHQTDVIVPFDPARSPAAADRVLLTREQFIDLWNLARPNEKFAAPAPRDGVLADAFYQCTLKTPAGGTPRVSVTATLILVSFRDAAITLPVPLSGVALNSARLDGQAAVMRTVRSAAPQARRIQKGNTQAVNAQPAGIPPAGRDVLEVVLPTRGPHTLDLQFDVAAQGSARTGQFTVPVFPSPSGRLVFRLPEAALAVRVNGSTNAWRRVTGTDQSAPAIVVPVGSGKPLTIAWRPPQQQGMADAIVHVDTATTVRLDDQGLSETARVSLSVPQGRIADLSFTVPPGLKIRGLAGPQLSGWETSDVDGQRRLRVFFNPPVSGQTHVDVQLFPSEPVTETETTLSLTTIAPLNVTRDSGTIVVSATDSFRLRAGQTAGLRQIELNADALHPGTTRGAPRANGPGTAPARPAGPVPPAMDQQLAWRYAARPFSLQIAVSRRQAESTVRVEHAIVVQRRKIQIGSRMVASLKGAPRSALTLELVDGYLPLSVQATALADWYVTGSDGTQPPSLTVEFSAPQLGDVEVIVVGRVTKDPRDLIVEIIPPFPLEMTRRVMWAGVWIDDAYTATVSDLSDWSQTDPNRLPVDIHNRQPRPVPYAFSSTASQAGLISFEIGQAQPRLSADAVVVTTVADTFLDYSLALNWKIDAAATDHLNFVTPLSLKDRLKVQGASIRSVTSEQIGEELRWTIQLNDAVRDRYFALATATLPPAETTVTAPAVRFEQPVFDEFGDAIGFEQIDRQRLYSLLVNHSQAQLSGQHGSSIEPVPAEDLPIRIGTHLTDQAAEILRVRDVTNPPVWTMRRFEQTVGAAASVNVADLTLVIHQDGTWRSRAVYTVRNLRRQFLGVRLPPGARLLSLFVRDQPSRPVLTELEDRTIHLIPLPKTGHADVSFAVRLVLTGRFDRPLPSGLTLNGEELDLPAPHVVTPNESPDYGIPVARTLWNVWLPHDIDARLIDDGQRTNVNVATDDDTTEAYLTSQLSDFSALLSVTTGSSYSRRSQNVAASRLKQLGQDVQDFGKDLRSDELREQFEQVQQQFRDNQQRIDALAADEAGGSPAGAGDPAQQTRTSVNLNNQALLFGNSFLAARTLSEDINRNGVLDAGEDLNGNGVLDALSADMLGVQAPDQPAAERAADAASAAARDDTFGYRLTLKAPRTPAAQRGNMRQPLPGLPDTGRDKAVRSDGKSTGQDTAETAETGRESRLQQRQQSVSNLENLNSFFRKNTVAGPAADARERKRSMPNAPERSLAGQHPAARTGADRPQSEAGARARRNRFSADRFEPGGLGGTGTAGISGQPSEPSVTMSAVNAAGIAGAGQPPSFPGAVPASAQTDSPEWTHVGGLSLPVEIPTSGYRLTFSKVAGQPRLGLRVQSREVVDRGIGLVWTVVWLVIAAAMVAISRTSSVRRRQIPALLWIVFAIGLLVFLLLPAPAGALGFVMLAVAWLIHLARFARPGQNA